MNEAAYHESVRSQLVRLANLALLGNRLIRRDSLLAYSAQLSDVAIEASRLSLIHI